MGNDGEGGVNGGKKALGAKNICAANHRIVMVFHNKLMTRNSVSAYVVVFVCLMFSTQGSKAQLNSTQKEDIGFTALQLKLGAAMPTGAGVSVSQVEAPEASTNYRPDASVFTDKNFIYGSGGSTGASSHATTVGRYFYGSSSLAPSIGVSPQRVTSYEANGFLQTNSLQLLNTGLLPSVEGNDVQNHSWVGKLNTEAQNIDAIRRIDYAIQRDNFVATFGVNNGSTNLTSDVPLMSGAYNGITVGLSNGNHSRGDVTLDGGVRTRPDIVVPTTATSWAAPTVGGAAALLIESARGTSGLGNADRSVVVKSLLLTGASRDEPEFGGSWSNSVTRPLDAVYGAGELNVLHSHDLLMEGEHDASASSAVAATGWDLGTSSAAVPQLYFFDLGTPDSFFEIAASLVWNRQITATDTQPGPSASWSFTPSLANLNLRLFNADGFVLGSEIGASLSETDNVELLLANSLAPGRYAWQVTSDTSGIDYGFSWNVETITAVPEPGVPVLASVGLLFLVFRRR